MCEIYKKFWNLKGRKIWIGIDFCILREGLKNKLNLSDNPLFKLFFSLWNHPNLTHSESLTNGSLALFVCRETTQNSSSKPGVGWQLHRNI